MRRLACALAVLSLACDSTEPPEPAPDLTGSYDLLSITSPDVASGATLTPPAAVATLNLVQYTGDDERAIGDVIFDIEVDHPTMTTSTSASGDYGHEVNGGEMSMKLSGLLFLGNYTLAGDTLTMNLAGDLGRIPFPIPYPTGTTVWLRDESP